MQLAGIGDADVGVEIGPGIEHPLEGVERLVVASELDERVAERAVCVGVAGVGIQRSARPGERLLEVVSRQRDGAGAEQAGGILGIDRERVPEDAVRLGVEGWVPVLARLLEVGEAEFREGRRVSRRRCGALLESRDGAVCR